MQAVTDSLTKPNLFRHDIFILMLININEKSFSNQIFPEMGPYLLFVLVVNFLRKKELFHGSDTGSFEPKLNTSSIIIMYGTRKTKQMNLIL